MTNDGSLGWGRRYLMCRPDYFAVAYEINPWMHREVSVDVDRAQGQWQGLVNTLATAGATVEFIDPAPHVPDLVFTANAGLVDGRRFIPARFRHAARAASPPRACQPSMPCARPARRPRAARPSRSLDIA